MFSFQFRIRDVELWIAFTRWKKWKCDKPLSFILLAHIITIKFCLVDSCAGHNSTAVYVEF